MQKAIDVFASLSGLSEVRDWHRNRVTEDNLKYFDNTQVTGRGASMASRKY
ncbi:hypothetical protein H2136_08210 [Aeromonas hydrophila]|uniref:Uncharacterized protein n=1 Tax=Aeromonas hydrophila TaxID=644 RepID=A0A926FNA4_AERHY|nr:hypothetical protein [Aeromonas hydrophila]